jgi:hypothetical protein
MGPGSDLIPCLCTHLSLGRGVGPGMGFAPGTGLTPGAVGILYDISNIHGGLGSVRQPTAAGGVQAWWQAYVAVWG